MSDAMPGTVCCGSPNACSMPDTRPDRRACDRGPAARVHARRSYPAAGSHHPHARAWGRVEDAHRVPAGVVRPSRHTDGSRRRGPHGRHLHDRLRSPDDSAARRQGHRVYRTDAAPAAVAAPRGGLRASGRLLLRARARARNRSAAAPASGGLHDVARVHGHHDRRDDVGSAQGDDGLRRVGRRAAAGDAPARTAGRAADVRTRTGVDVHGGRAQVDRRRFSRSRPRSRVGR